MARPPAPLSEDTAWTKPQHSKREAGSEDPVAQTADGGAYFAVFAMCAVDGAGAGATTPKPIIQNSELITFFNPAMRVAKHLRV